MSLKKRIIAALTALALLILPLAACGGKGNGTATSDAPVTDLPDTRIDLASYTIVRGERSSAYVTNAARNLRNEIKDRFGVEPRYPTTGSPRVTTRRSALRLCPRYSSAAPTAPNRKMVRRGSAKTSGASAPRAKR